MLDTGFVRCILNLPMSAATTLPESVLEPLTREFVIVLAKQAALVAELERLAKRAKRIGAPTIAWEFGEVEQREVKVRVVREAEADILPSGATHRTRLVPFVHLTLTGTRPVIAGWEFAATVQHVDGVNILRNCPRAEELYIPEIYRTRGSVCDHCKLDRDRRDTYLVVSGEGEWKQIGSSCLKDFAGYHKDPHQIAEYAEMLASALSLCDGAGDDEDGGFGFGGRGEPVFSVVEYLKYVAAEIRESGWVSRSAADPERGVVATADRACDRIDPQRPVVARDRSVTDADVAVATASYEWALALTATDGERLNDYLWNLFAVAKSGIVERRTFGLAASMVAAYTKAEVRKRELANRKPSEHVGTVGETRSFVLTLDRHFSFDGAWGPVNRYIFRDGDGNVFTWKASSGSSTIIGLEYPNDRMVEGGAYILTARVKEHDDYKGTKQTVLTFAAVRPHDEIVFQTMRDEEVRKVLGKKVRGGTATDEERVQFKVLDAKAREAAKAKRSEVARFANFETTLRMVHFPISHEVVAVVGTDLHVDYVVGSSYKYDESGNRVVVESASINVYDRGTCMADYHGADALDKARKFVAERLAKANEGTRAETSEKGGTSERRAR